MAKGNALVYESLEMSEYLTAIENDLSISEKSGLLGDQKMLNKVQKENKTVQRTHV